MKSKVISLFISIAAIILGIYLSMTTTRIFYGLVLAGILYGIYDIYLIANHKQTAQEEEKAQKKLAEQKAFSAAPSVENADETPNANSADQAEKATIIVHWFKEKMGLGAMSVTVNGVDAGTIKKDNLQVVYHTDVPFNVIMMGVYKAEIELSPGDTVEYFVAGNGIREDRTIITRK